ncbi:MAG: type IV pilus secretin PilQ [bacterium]|nr:type IV pilus secretin PilQ [bacterium]MDT8365899.1 type IV pilus secretin PilQ [bacterium]
MKRFIAKLPWVLLAVFALVASGCAAPKSQMRSSVEEAALASVTSVTGEELPDRVRLNIEGTATLAYTVFRLSEPLRLIVDLADTDITGLGELITVDLGNVATVSPIQLYEDAGRIGRLEVSLVELWDYETSRADNTIIIDFLKPVTVSEETPQADEMLPAQPVSDKPPVEVVELELTPGGETTDAQGEIMAEGTAAAQVQEDLPPAGFINSVLFVEAGDGLTVEFVADGSVSEYLTMELSDPTRLVLDVQNVAKGFAPSRIPVEMGGVTNIRVGEHYDQNKLRFVFDMEGDQIPPYFVESAGSGLVLRIGEGVVPVQQIEAAAAQPEFEPEPASSFTEVSASAQVAMADKSEESLEPAPATAVAGAVAQSDSGVSEIRYRAEVSGGAVLVISDPPVEYEISQPDASHLLIDLRDVALSRDLVRSQDTRDMDGALQSMSSYNPRGGGGGRISLTFIPGTTYEVDQTGGTLTVSLTAPAAVPMAQSIAQKVQPEAVALIQTPVSPALVPAAATASATEKMVVEDIAVPREVGPQYTGERITLDFQNADLLNVLRLIAEVSGLNIITAEGVGGKISMRMQDVPWDQALDIILKTKGLGQVREGNVVRIAPRAILEGERIAELKAKEAEVKMENLILEIVPISYSKAEDLVSQLNSFLSARGSITTDKRTNSLIVKDIEENVKKIKDLVGELDVPTPQVRIEARIVIVDEGYVKNLGIQWGGVHDDGAGTQIFGESGTSSTGFSGALVNMPASNANTVLGFTFGNINNFTNLDLRLSALEQTNNGRIISSPSLLVIQNETANIEVNNPFPENRTSTEVSDEGSTTTTEVSFPDIWTKLKITPQVTSSDDIFMEVLVEKDSKGQQAVFDDNIFTGVNKHKLETKIILKNHGTAVIGGLYTENEGQSNSSVPFFSKIPVLGWLFKNKNTSNNRDELLIFINATIVEG